MNEPAKITCPDCQGRKILYYLHQGGVCERCLGYGTIPDRRAPSTADIELQQIRWLIRELVEHPVIKAVVALENARAHE